ncbi:MAG: tRNA (N6-threonylcarbamoyladenosine(37)-N6)-methyltransferase TrmO [Thalassolituus sp.]|nr:MAG: tRNA (N6-threonylcarbamoyladenosine(37)-N6)-methyltransferase TrmO [Thalassolituus sp.]
MSSHTITPVAYARSPFQEKFAIPRQPGLAPSVRTCIELTPPFDDPCALEGLNDITHVWLLFLFHQVGSRNDSLRVRPPRLGGNEKTGVFSTRSTHRPNGIGQSLVKVESVEGSCLWVSGADLLDGTPIIDIKPFVPYADIPVNAGNRMAPAAPEWLEVIWTEATETEARKQGQRLRENVMQIVTECLQQDPRPAYQKHDESRVYGVRLWDLQVRWRYPTPDSIQLVSISEASDDTPPDA